MIEALIDLDILLYRCAGGAQKRRYTVYDRETRVVFGEFNLSKEAKQFAGDNAELSIDYFVIPGEFNHALHNFRVSLDGILSSVGSSSFRLFGSSPTNELFRSKIATIKPYKGNRDGAERPYHYHRLKEFLYGNYDIEVVDGLEADDLLGIAQYSSFKASTKENPGTVLCSTDKDLDQIPGWHYNFVDNVKYWVSEEDALYTFYRQLIRGDPTDNIPGIPKYGDALAIKLLNNYDLPRQEPELQKKILSLYEDAYKEKGLDAMIENGRLVKILREPIEDITNLWSANYVS